MAIASKIVSWPDWFTDLNSSDFDVKLDVQIEQPMPLGFDALAWLMKIRSQHPDNIKYANAMFSASLKGPVSVDSIEPEFVASADAIRRHFKNKLLLTSLRGEVVSPFRQRLTEVVENPCQLLSTDIPVLLRMPDFYLEDQEMELIIKNYQSVDTDERYQQVDDRFHYVGRVTRVVKHHPQYRYYFSNSNRNLLCIRIPTDSHFLPMLTWFCDKQDGIGVRGNLTVSREVGYGDFKFYHLEEKYEIF